MIFDKKNELADENQRLHEESAMAVQQLQKFTECFFANNWKSLDYFLPQNWLIFVNFSKMPEEFAMAIQRFANNGISKQFWKSQGFFSGIVQLF